MQFSVTFGEAIDESSFTAGTVTSGVAGDVSVGTFTGATNVTITEIAPNNHTTYRLDVTGMTTSANVVISIAAGSVLNASGTSSNTASTPSSGAIDFKKKKFHPRRRTKRHEGKNREDGHCFVFLGVSSWMTHFLEVYSYSQTLTASGGTPGYTFSLTSGMLPTGLTLDGATLSGNLSGSGTFNFTLQARDANGCTGSREYSVTVNCPSITATVSGGGVIARGTTATIAVNVVGGTAPYTVTLTNGGGTQMSSSLPISFTVSPTATTSYQVQSARDAYGCAASAIGSATVTVRGSWNLDFNGDGKADIAGRNQTTGEVQVGLSGGTHFLTSSAWGTWRLSYDLHLESLD